MKARALKEEELNTMLARSPRLGDRCFIVLGYYTGFRVSELLSLQVNSFSTNLSSVVVERGSMKGKKQSRRVALHRKCAAYIREYVVAIPSGSCLFPFSRVQAHRIMKKAIGIDSKGISCSSLRKAFAQRVYASSGNNILVTQRAMGHASLSSTTYYLDVGQDLVDTAILA